MLTTKAINTQKVDENAQTVVLVEDDESNSETIIQILLTETPYRVLALSSGDEVLARLEEIKALQPILFLFDYFLPTMTGIELYDRLRAMEDLAHIPAFFVTAHLTHDIEEQASARDLDLLYKPFELDDFLHTLR